MLDVTKKIANLLKGIAPVELAGSEKELELPSIYIQYVSNASDVVFDNKDFLTAFTYQIDIYAETPLRCMEIATEVDEKMQADGWRRANGQLLGRQRYVLTYKAQVSEKFNTYQ